jgi:acyl carrier protein
LANQVLQNLIVGGDMGLDMVEIFIEVEDLFDCHLPEDSSIQTIGDLEDWIINNTGKWRDQGWSILSVRMKVRELIKNRLNLSFEVLPEHRFVDDLGCD